MKRHRITHRSFRNLSIALALVAGVAAFFLLSHRVEATNKFWIAGSPGNFSTDANWSLTSGGPPNTTAPGASDVAFFDGNGTGNCTIAANASVDGINIGSGYSGAITVASGVTVNVGGTGFSQSGGTFNGGSSGIDINGDFLLKGTGVFNSTTGTLFLGSAFDHNTSTNPGGTFNHNNGTVTFDGSLGGINSELSGTIFNNVNFDHTSQRVVFNTSGGGPTMTVLGALAFNDGQLFGSRIEARGAVTFAPNFDGAPVNHATLVIANGSGPRTITFAAGTNMLNVILNDPNATIQTSGSGALNWRSLVLEAGTINQGGVAFAFPPGGPGNYTQSGGTFNASVNPIAFGSAFTQSGGTFNGGSGDIDVNGNFLLQGTGVFNSTTATLFLGSAFDHDTFSFPGGTFNHNNGTVVFDDGGTGGINVSSAGETFNNLTFNLPDAGQRGISGGPLIALGTLTLNNGTLFGGTLRPQGNMTIANTFDGGNNTSVTFSGSADQTFTNNGGATPTGNWTVDKSARAVTLASDLTLQPGQQLNITSGILDQGASFNLTAGPITVGSAGRLQNRGTGDLTLSGNISNSGFINFNGGGIANCGDADSILIRSSVDGTQRTWSGDGSFSMTDVDVKDQNAANPPVIIALNSTDSGNNANWTFDPGCGPTEVTLESFTATGFEDGTVLIEWRTGFEASNLGFNIYRDEAGRRTPVNSQIVAGSALTAGSTLVAGRSYAWPDIFKGQGANYWLEDIDLNLGSTWHGPFYVKPAEGKPPAGSRAALLSEIGKDVTENRQAAPVEMRATQARLSSNQMAESADLATKPAVKIAVEREAWYRITQPELVAAGLDPTLDPRRLQLIADGRQQRILVAGEEDGRFDAQDWLEFYGTGLDSPFTNSRTYWLVASNQPGLRVSQSTG
ncbi:MAG TPA: hypothetical protein VFO63_19190, partial [Blastocatellia bacterium]|nr:hypothetical protein [Blastocatellia bacterium]